MVIYLVRSFGTLKQPFQTTNFQLGHSNESVVQKAVTISRKGTLRPDLVSRTGIFAAGALAKAAFMFR